MDRLCQYFDNLIKASIPNPLNERYEEIHHPCKKHFADIPERDKDADLNHCIRAVQMHRCTKGYCQRKIRNSNNFACRFKYPKELETRSSVGFDENNKLFFKAERNEPMLNTFNSDILQLWRANMDIQPITSLDSVIHYIAKYASKAESRSKALINLTRNALQNGDETRTVRQIIQQILIKMVSERDYSAQEVFYVLNDWKMYRSSRQFVTICLEESSFVFVEIDENSRLNRKDKLREYMQRDLSTFGGMSLYDYYAMTTSRTGGSRSIRSRSMPLIVRILPKLQYNPEGNNEEFFKQKAIVFVPFRTLLELESEKGQRSWESFYLQKLSSLSGTRPSSRITSMDRLNLAQLVEEVDSEDEKFKPNAKEERAERNEAEIVSALFPNQIP